MKIIKSFFNDLPYLGILHACFSTGTGSSQVFQGEKVSIWESGVGSRIHWIASQLETMYTSFIFT